MAPRLAKQHLVAVLVVCGLLFVGLAIGVPIAVVQAQATKNQAAHTAHLASASSALTEAFSDQGKEKVAAAAGAVLAKPPPPNFPIDALYTWVKGSDPEWWKTKARIYEQFYGTPFKQNPRDPLETAGDKDELYYSVRMSAKFCPWLRRIWIFSAPGHRPAWMPPEGDMALGQVLVTVVHHDRVFDPACVKEPITFNSNVIESQIPHIARLAECFILLNDDCFFGRPLARSDFFTAQGLPAVHLRDVTAALKTMTTMWSQHLRNMQREAVALGATIGKVPDHVAAPLRKSMLKAVVKALQPKVCVMRPFRTHTDFPSWYVTMNVTPSVPRPTRVTSMYFGTGPAFVQHMRAKGTATKQAPSLFCINQEFDEETQRVLDTLL